LEKELEKKDQQTEQQTKEHNEKIEAIEKKLVESKDREKYYENLFDEAMKESSQLKTERDQANEAKKDLENTLKKAERVKR
jgi:septal ring factor EnvC (AmiA/AmiB activator)